MAFTKDTKGKKYKDIVFNKLLTSTGTLSPSEAGVITLPADVAEGTVKKVGGDDANAVYTYVCGGKALGKCKKDDLFLCVNGPSGSLPSYWKRYAAGENIEGIMDVKVASDASSTFAQQSNSGSGSS